MLQHTGKQFKMKEIVTVYKVYLYIYTLHIYIKYIYIPHTLYITCINDSI